MNTLPEIKIYPVKAAAKTPGSEDLQIVTQFRASALFYDRIPYHAQAATPHDALRILGEYWSKNEVEIQKQRMMEAERQADLEKLKASGVLDKKPGSKPRRPRRAAAAKAKANGKQPLTK